MKKLCIGTFFTIISQARKTSSLQRKLLGAVLCCANQSSYYEDDTFQGHLKSGKENLTSEYIGYLQGKTIDEIEEYFDTTVTPHIDLNKKKALFLSLRAVIAEDTSIDNDTLIGLKDGYDKTSILTKNTFSFSGFLANVYAFCVLSVDNKPYKENIKEIDKNYVTSFLCDTTPVHFDEKIKIAITPLTTTVRGSDFDSIFTEVAHGESLAIPNAQQTKIYHLDVINNEFDYNAIQKFIKTNIGRYVFSRAKRNNYKGDAIEDITSDALTAYKRKLAATPGNYSFAEIMLYSFLECVLGAPKIMSKIELQSSGGEYTSKTSGIHLLPIANGIATNHQLVFGATDVLADFQQAVDSAFAQIMDIKDSSSDEYSFVESTILNGVFDGPTTAYMKSVILPQKGGSTKPDTAFGIFLGYTVDVPGAENLSNDEYRAALQEKMQQDIKTYIPYINSKIASNKLSRYSFYIYVLPLNDAVNDKDNIMKKALEV